MQLKSVDRLRLSEKSVSDILQLEMLLPLEDHLKNSEHCFAHVKSTLQSKNNLDKLLKITG